MLKNGHAAQQFSADSVLTGPLVNGLPDGHWHMLMGAKIEWIDDCCCNGGYVVTGGHSVGINLMRGGQCIRCLE